VSIESSLVEFLQSVTTEIYPVVLPEKHTLPAISYYLNSSRRRYSADGPSTYPADIQLNLWASTYSGVKTLQADVIELINGYSGTFGDYYVDPIAIENEADVYEDDTGYFGVTLFFSIWYRSP
jgi:hypothetical protein